MLFFKDFVGVRLLPKLLVYKPVLPCEGLDVFGELSYFLSFQLGKRCLMFETFLKTSDFPFQEFDFLLSLKHLPLQIIFFTNRNTHLVLYVAEIKGLPVQLLFRRNQLLSFNIKIVLNIVDVVV